MSTQPPPYSEYDQGFSKQTPAGGLYPTQQSVSYQNTAQVYTYPVVQQFREVPCRVVCQFCNRECVTKIKYKKGTLTWISCFFIGLIIPLGCCFAPFCIKSMKDAVHHCPHCNEVIGRYNRM